MKHAVTSMIFNIHFIDKEQKLFSQNRKYFYFYFRVNTFLLLKILLLIVNVLCSYQIVKKNLLIIFGSLFTIIYTLLKIFSEIKNNFCIISLTFQHVALLDEVKKVTNNILTLYGPNSFFLSFFGT